MYKIIHEYKNKIKILLINFINKIIKTILKKRKQYYIAFPIPQ